MNRTTDMTRGNPASLIIKFALPLIITNLGQQFYAIADASIVGRGVGMKALAAVGAADWIYWLILWTIMMLTQGFSTFISRFFGEKNYLQMNKTVTMSAVLCIISGVILTVGGLLVSRPLLTVMSTPEDIIDGSVVYLHTMISGTVIVIAYNMLSSILRALGDGKSPLVAMIISAVLNIALDMCFVFIFKWGIFGAALASVTSQLFAFSYCLLRISKSEIINIEKKHWNPDFKLIKELLCFSLPLALQYIIINLGGMILQSTINLYGSIFVAGFTATNKLYGLLEGSAISLGAAFSTYFAQNFGAGNPHRIKQGHKYAVILSVVTALIIMTFTLAFDKLLLSLFLDTSINDSNAAMDIALHYLKTMSVCLVILYLIYVYRSILQSAGISAWSLISGFGEFAVRVLMAKAVVLHFGQSSLYYAEPLAWLAALLFVMIPFFVMKKKLYSKQTLTKA